MVAFLGRPRWHLGQVGALQGTSIDDFVIRERERALESAMHLALCRARSKALHDEKIVVDDHSW
jgi:hypothetical protein